MRQKAFFMADAPICSPVAFVSPIDHPHAAQIQPSPPQKRGLPACQKLQNCLRSLERIVR
jgi:hypothetical protein